MPLPGALIEVNLGERKMNYVSRSWKGAIAAGGLALGLMAPFGAAIADSGSVVVPSHSNAYGNKFSEWSAEWWQYILSLPVSSNPLFDPDGSQCIGGQRGPVWFLAGSFDASTRNCSVPDGVALFFPIINVVDVNTTNQTVKELRAETAPCLDAVTSLSVVVDGVPISGLDQRFRIRSNVFSITVPENNLFGIDAGTYSPAIDDGFYVMLNPLGVGAHTVQFQGASGGCPLIGGPFSAIVTYELTVVPVTLH
jgi:hypothetical protein